jgi:hypothetical protein
VNNFCSVIKIPFYLLVLPPHLINLAVFCLKLLLLVCEVLSQLALVHLRAHELLL